MTADEMFRELGFSEHIRSKNIDHIFENPTTGRMIFIENGRVWKNAEMWMAYDFRAEEIKAVAKLLEEMEEANHD